MSEERRIKTMISSRTDEELMALKDRMDRAKAVRIMLGLGGDSSRDHVLELVNQTLKEREAQKSL